MTPLGKTVSPTSPTSKMSEASLVLGGACQLKASVWKPVYPHPHVAQPPPALKPATLTCCCETWLGVNALLTARVATGVVSPPAVLILTLKVSLKGLLP